MPKQNLVQTWLEAIGLAPEVMQTFEAAGIVDPKDLAELEISHYPALGVKEPGDRKKLFLLIQRVIMAHPETGENSEQVTKKNEWQHAGQQTGVEEEGGVHNDNFLSDDDDGIDKALEEQYRPLLEPSYSDDLGDDLSTGSEHTNSSSQEEIPSPPPSKTRASHYKKKMFFTKKQGKERLSSDSYKKQKAEDGERSGGMSDSTSEKARKPRFKKNLSGLFKHMKKGPYVDSSSVSHESYHHALDASFSQDSSPDRKSRKSALPRITVGSSKIEVKAAPSPRHYITKKDSDKDGKTKISMMKDRNQEISINETVSSEKWNKPPGNIDISYESDNNKLPNIDSSSSKQSSSKLIPNAKDGTLSVARRSRRLQEKKMREMESQIQRSTIDPPQYDISSTSIYVGNVDEEEHLVSETYENEPSPTKTSRQRHDSTASADSIICEKEHVTSGSNEDEEFDAHFEDLEWTEVSPHDNRSMPSSTIKDDNSDRRSNIYQNNKIASRESNRLVTIPSDRTMLASPPAVLTKKELDGTIESIIEDDILSARSNTSSKTSRSKKQKDRVKVGGRPSHSGGVIPNHHRSHRRVDDDETKASVSSAGTTRSGPPKSRKSSLHDRVNRAKSSPRSRPKTPPARDLPTRQASAPRLEPCGSKSFDNCEPNGRGKSKNNRQRTVATNSPNGVFVHGKQKVKSWKEQVNKLRDENDEQFENERDSRYNLDPADEMRIRVIVRKRPMSRKEKAKSDEVDVIHPLQYHSYGRIMVYQPKTKVDLTREVESLPFAFDNVFGEKLTNKDIYRETMKNLIPGVFEGRWASVFAYGQTGSGKTFTMMGSTLTGIKAGNRHVNHEENLGLYYLAAQDVFELASRPEFSRISIHASLFEIYSGKLFDLLNKRQPIRCLENHKGRVCFPGLSEHTVSNAEDLMNVIEEGSMNRSTGSTSANRDSSRSHAVLQLHLRKSKGRKENVEHGRLTFIDLAGSERGADTSKASRTTRLEGAEINTSLLALKEVIRALATGDSLTHVPFRGSKLTQVLKEGFVGKKSRTVMVACVAPNITNCEHTLNTLRYADRVKERDSVTGQLNATMASASKVAKNEQKPSKSRQETRPSDGSNDDWHNNNSHDEDEDDDDNWLSDLDDMDGGAKTIEEDDGDLDELNEVLSSPSNTVEEETLFAGLSKKEAVAPLVSSHRSIMTEMLGMVKQEMTLVNNTDADRALIDEYLNELEEIQEKQLSMISTLRNSLVEYYSERPQSGQEGNLDKSLVSDASFDDLRSLGN